MSEFNWENIYEKFNFIKWQNSKEIQKFMVDNINSDNGWFLNRLGGSDFNAVFMYLKFYKNINNTNYIMDFKDSNGAAVDATCFSNFDYEMQQADPSNGDTLNLARIYNLVAEFNGYFDKTTNNEIRLQNFLKYLDKMYNCYINSSAYTNAGRVTETSFPDPSKNFKGVPLLNNFIKSICRDKSLIHYYYIEGVHSTTGGDFMKDFKIFAENKKVLIISPFSESIKYQTKPDRINNLINGYTFPNCTFLTYDTPITYNSYKDNSSDDILNQVTTNNWLEQCEKMEEEISKIDFDVALLSCASYACCLGSFISTKMNKKAIYIGGVLNVIFNIYGKRYTNEYYNNINNLSYRIKSLETKKYENATGGKLKKNEAFNAYF